MSDFLIIENRHFWPVFDENRRFFGKKGPFLVKNGYFR